MLYALYQNEMDNGVIVKEEAKEKTAHQHHMQDVLSYYCLCHGATYQGRRAAASTLLGITQKVPILLSEQQELLFPTHSPASKDCCWINYYAVCCVYRRGRGSAVLFPDGSLLSLSCSYHTLKIQMQRCQSYDALLQKNQHKSS